MRAVGRAPSRCRAIAIPRTERTRIAPTAHPQTEPDMKTDDDIPSRSRREAINRMGAGLAVTPALLAQRAAAQAPVFVLLASQEASFVTGNVYGSTAGKVGP